MATGKVQSLKDTGEWERDCAPHLLAAVAGGQWPQIKKAHVPKWGITDTRCQLCYDAVGTTEHRYKCKFVKPALGWSMVPDKARLAAGRIGNERLRLLKTT